MSSKTRTYCSGRCWSVVPTGTLWVNFWSGHIPRLRVRPLVPAYNPQSGIIWEATNRYLSVTSMFPSLPLSLEAMKKCPWVRIKTKQNKTKQKQSKNLLLGRQGWENILGRQNNMAKDTKAESALTACWELWVLRWPLLWSRVVPYCKVVTRHQWLFKFKSSCHGKLRSNRRLDCCLPNWRDDQHTRSKCTLLAIEMLECVVSSQILEGWIEEKEVSEDWNG